ncbi:TIGR03088 family PEP-CTERM/XrtA system glycosyltransferase [Zoogloea sp.]|uniref:TIGR03088 family PEP-CTERM/XrtA system glycosyltransferase n=1 Tax=Zoogloea sp. TaxID=49181 RepID=UPI0035AF84E0
MNDSRPLIIHIVYSFDVGGLENGIVNLINRMPVERFRHMIVALAYCSPSFCQRIQRSDVEFVSINKGAGHGFKLYPKIYRMLRQLKPAVVHTRNLAALEMVVPAWLAGVPLRLHGEHGWDNSDPDGRSRKYQFVRRLYSPFVSKYIALSRTIESYLVDRVGIEAERIRRICNGVNADRFVPAATRRDIAGSPFNDPELFVIGTVGRQQAVKDQATLVHAFAAFVRGNPEAARRARLILVGDGPLAASLADLVKGEGLDGSVWMAGERSDVPEIMRGLDMFVLPSQAEGISNTLLEAMASGLPVVATAVGGNPELVVDHQTGLLVPPQDPERMAQAFDVLFSDSTAARAMGQAGRERVLTNFSMDAMMGNYLALYEGKLNGAI